VVCLLETATDEGISTSGKEDRTDASTHHELERTMLLQTMNDWWWRRAMRLLCCCQLFVASPRCEAQNLVPNPSFEVVDGCPQYPALLGFQPGAIPQHWFSASDTPDYFNACVDTIAGVPSNVFGFQEALDGQTYMGMATFLTDDLREMICAQMLTPLTIGETYYVSMYVNAAYGGNQPIDVGSNNIGVLFTMEPYEWVYPMPQFGLRNFAHVYSADVITDTLGWTLVSGSFVADSAYRYLVIGNHFENALTDTAFIGPSPWGIYYGWAYSLVDQVCVSPNPQGCPLANGIDDTAERLIGVFPNPARHDLHVRFGESLVGEVRVMDMLGRPVWRGGGGGMDRMTLRVADWAKGQYVLQWMAADGMRSFKFVIAE